MAFNYGTFAQRGVNENLFSPDFVAGELFERVIDEDFILTERACACFIRQICEAIEYMHSKRIIHLDMKVNEKGEFQVIL